jgi:hypothetical protein
MSHTPGPWHLEVEPDALHVYSPVEEVVHFTDAGWDESTRATFEANARLIAAAPDLLAALEEIAEWGEWESAPIARAAIAKAKGA